MKKRNSNVGEKIEPIEKPTKEPEQEKKTQGKSRNKQSKPKPNVVFQIINGKFNQNIEEGGKEMDPYIKIKFLEGEIKTQVALNAGKAPTWNFKESIYIEDLEQDLLVELWEWDKNTTDDYLAAAKINLQSAFNHNGKQFALEMLRKGTGIEYLFQLSQAFGFINMQIIEIQEDIKYLLDNEKKYLFQVKLLMAYLQSTGLEKSFQIIFAEILNHNIPSDKAFVYSALRLRQIGRDLDNIRDKKYDSRANNQNEEETKKILEENESEGEDVEKQNDQKKKRTDFSKTPEKNIKKVEIKEQKKIREEDDDDNEKEKSKELKKKEDIKKEEEKKKKDSNSKEGKKKDEQSKDSEKKQEDQKKIEGKKEDEKNKKDEKRQSKVQEKFEVKLEKPEKSEKPLKNK